MQKELLLDVLKRILINAYNAKSLIDEGKEIKTGRKIDAIIDQLTRLIGTVGAGDPSVTSPEVFSPYDPNDIGQ
jgi:hypothetical protein